MEKNKKSISAEIRNYFYLLDNDEFSVIFIVTHFQKQN